MVKCISLPKPWGKALVLFCDCVYLHILIEHSTACFARLRYPGLLPGWIITFGLSSPSSLRQVQDSPEKLQFNEHLLWKSYYGKLHSSSSSPLSSCLAEFILSHLMGKLRLRERLGIWPRPHMTKWLNWDSNLDISDPKACASFPLLYSSFREKNALDMLLNFSSTFFPYEKNALDQKSQPMQKRICNEK